MDRVVQLLVAAPNLGARLRYWRWRAGLILRRAKVPPHYRIDGVGPICATDFVGPHPNWCVVEHKVWRI